MTPEADISKIGSIEFIDTHTVVRPPTGDRVKVWFNGNQKKWCCSHWQNETYVGIGSSAYEAYKAYILLCKLAANRETNRNMVWIQNYSCPPCCHNYGKFQIVQTSDTQTQFCVYCGKQLRFDSTQQVMYNTRREDMVISIEKAKLDEFYALYESDHFCGQRLGQAFFNHFDLHKCVQNKPQFDRLYNMDGDTARQHIRMLVEPC